LEKNLKVRALIRGKKLRKLKSTTAQRCRSETEKFILEDLFRSVLSQFKIYHPFGNLKFNNIRIFQNLKLRYLMGKILRIFLKRNSTPNTLGCYGLIKCIKN